MTTYVEDDVTVTSLEGSFWAYPNPGELHFDPEGFGNKTFDFTYAGGAFDVLSFGITFAGSDFLALLEGRQVEHVIIGLVELGDGVLGIGEIVDRLRLRQVGEEWAGRDGCGDDGHISPP